MISQVDWVLLFTIVIVIVIGTVQIVSLRRSYDRLYKLKWSPYYPYEMRARAWEQAERLVDFVTSERQLLLTSGARLMLVIPLAEALERPGVAMEEAAQDSLFLLADRLREEAVDRRDRDLGRMRSSFSVIRAYWREFCNIPPFCSPSETGRERG